VMMNCPTVSPELFVRTDGQPMAFLMGPTGYERHQVKNIVEAGGGVILGQPTIAYRDHVIRLLVRTEMPIKKDQDMYDYKYILHCAEKDELLPNLCDYRVTSHVPSVFQSYNPLHILLGNLKWSEVPRKLVGEKVSDIEEEEDDATRLYENEYKHHKSQKLPYSKKEQQEVVDWIVKYSAYKLLRGNLVWKRMEYLGVGRGRSWQSLRQHFLKVVITQIHTYGLSRSEVTKFKVGLGLLEEVPDSGTEFETREEAQARIKATGLKPISPKRKEMRKARESKTRSESSSSSSTSPSNVDRRRVIKGRRSKVPADKDDQTPRSSTTESVEKILPPLKRKGTEELSQDNQHIFHGKSPVKVSGVIPLTVGYHAEKSPAIVDVGQDPELELLLDQSVVPRDLGDRFPSSESEEVAGVLRKRVAPNKRKLFSDTYLDSVVEEETDVFAPSPLKKKSIGKNNLGVTLEMPSTEEFIEGLKEAALEVSNDSIAGGVTSTQNGLHIAGEEAEEQLINDEVFEDSDLNQNLVISESGGSVSAAGVQAAPAQAERSPSPPVRHSQLQPLHLGSPQQSQTVTSPRQSPQHISSHLQSESLPASPNQSDSLNLLAPDPTVDPSTYTLSQAVTDLEDMPVVEPRENTAQEDDDEPVNTADLVDALTSIGEKAPGAGMAVADDVPSNPLSNQPLPRVSNRRGRSEAAVPVPTISGVVPSMADQGQDQASIPADRNSGEQNQVYDFASDDDEAFKDPVMTGAASKHRRDDRKRKCVDTPKSGPCKRRGESSVKKGNNMKGVETHVGFSKGGELHMVVNNLPCDPSDIDSEDIELIRTGRERTDFRQFDKKNENANSDESVVDINGSDPEEDLDDNFVRSVRSREKVDVENPKPGPSKVGRNDPKGGRKKVKLKLKLITLRKENGKEKQGKAGRFVREGDYNDRFRLPYSRREEESIVQYFLCEGGYKYRKGNRVWQMMEEAGVCHGRTWQSMKQRWEKFLCRSLDKFGVTPKDLEMKDAQDGSETDEGSTEGSPANSSVRGFRSNANYYTTVEDLKILEFMVTNRRFDVGGRAMWETMESRAVLPGRSWHSIKERFRKVIIKNIRSYGLSEETIEMFSTKSRPDRLDTV